MAGLSRLLACSLLVFAIVYGNGKVLSPGVMNQNPGHLNRPDAGDFINCGNKSTEALMTFRPRHFSFGETIYITCHIIPPVDVESGTLELFVYVPGVPDPVYHKDGINFNCEKIHVYFSFMCPFKKGVPIDAHTKFYLSPDLPLPAGEVYLKVKFFQKPKPDKEFLCLFGHLSVLDG